MKQYHPMFYTLVLFSTTVACSPAARGSFCAAAPGVAAIATPATATELCKVIASASDQEACAKVGMGFEIADTVLRIAMVPVCSSLPAGVKARRAPQDYEAFFYSVGAKKKAQ